MKSFSPKCLGRLIDKTHVIFMQLLNITFKLAQSYYANKASFLAIRWNATSP